METIIAFNFSHAAILDFMTQLHCSIVSNKRTSALQQQRQRSDVIKSKMATRWKFKNRNLFRFFPCSNLASTYANSRGSLYSFSEISTSASYLCTKLSSIHRNKTILSSYFYCIFPITPTEANNRTEANNKTCHSFYSQDIND